MIKIINETDNKMCGLCRLQGDLGQQKELCFAIPETRYALEKSWSTEKRLVVISRPFVAGMGKWTV